MKSFNSLFPLLLALTLALTLASCRSTKKIAETGEVPATPAVERVRPQDAMKRVNTNAVNVPGMNARLKVNVEAGVNNISVGGSLKMRRNKVIQLSLMAFGLVEAGRLELTPDYFLVQDRIGHQYVKESWSHISALKEAGIDFYTFQALFWEELFIPGRKSNLRYFDFDFKEQPDAGTWILQPTEEAKESKIVAVRFLVNATNGLIRQTNLYTSERAGFTLEWQYNKWTSLADKDFPQQFSFNVKAGAKEYHAVMALSSLSVETGSKDIRTKIDTNRYRRVTLESVLGRLMSM